MYLNKTHFLLYLYKYTIVNNMERELTHRTEKPTKKRKSTIYFTPLPMVLIASLKEEPTFFYVPLQEYRKHKPLLKSLLRAEAESCFSETTEQQWTALFEEWYDKYTDYDDDIVEVDEQSVRIVKVLNMLKH